MSNEFRLNYNNLSNVKTNSFDEYTKSLINAYNKFDALNNQITNDQYLNYAWTSSIKKFDDIIKKRDSVDNWITNYLYNIKQLEEGLPDKVAQIVDVTSTRYAKNHNYNVAKPSTSDYSKNHTAGQIIDNRNTDYGYYGNYSGGYSGGGSGGNSGWLINAIGNVSNGNSNVSEDFNATKDSRWNEDISQKHAKDTADRGLNFHIGDFVTSLKEMGFSDEEIAAELIRRKIVRDPVQLDISSGVQSGIKSGAEAALTGIDRSFNVHDAMNNGGEQTISKTTWYDKVNNFIDNNKESVESWVDSAQRIIGKKIDNVFNKSFSPTSANVTLPSKPSVSQKSYSYGTSSNKIFKNPNKGPSNIPRR